MYAGVKIAGCNAEVMPGQVMLFTCILFRLFWDHYSFKLTVRFSLFVGCGTVAKLVLDSKWETISSSFYSA